MKKQREHGAGSCDEPASNNRAHRLKARGRSGRSWLKITTATSPTRAEATPAVIKSRSECSRGIDAVHAAETASSIARDRSLVNMSAR